MLELECENCKKIFHPGDIWNVKKEDWEFFSICGKCRKIQDLRLFIKRKKKSLTRF